MMHSSVEVYTFPLKEEYTAPYVYITWFEGRRQLRHIVFADYE